MTELEAMRRAKMYMDKLSQGIDPVSGAEMPEDSVLNHVRLARCFFYVSDVLQQVIDNGGRIGSKPKKTEFTLTPEQIAKVKLSASPLRIREFVDVIYRAVENPEMKKLSTTVITSWHLEKGFMTKENLPDGKSRRIPTEAGKSIGLSTEVRQGQYGEYLAVYYNADAQRFLLDNLDSILQKNP